MHWLSFSTKFCKQFPWVELFQSFPSNFSLLYWKQVQIKPWFAFRMMFCIVVAHKVCLLSFYGVLKFGLKRFETELALMFQKKCQFGVFSHDTLVFNSPELCIALIKGSHSSEDSILSSVNVSWYVFSAIMQEAIPKGILNLNRVNGKLFFIFSCSLGAEAEKRTSR